MSQPIAFTPDELALMRDTRFFPAKAIITDKIKQTLHHLHGALREEIAATRFLAPEGVDFETGQFVKGEHLLDFPYQYLDLPKFFTNAEKFAFRSLFWWGHHFIFAWILEGRHLPRYKENILNAYDRLVDRGLYLLMTETLWEWRKDPLYLLEIRMDNKEAVTSALASRPFLKIHRFIDLNDSRFEKGEMTKEGREAFRIMKAVVAL
jgi:hypothetical protein